MENNTVNGQRLRKAPQINVTFLVASIDSISQTWFL